MDAVCPRHRLSSGHGCAPAGAGHPSRRASGDVRPAPGRTRSGGLRGCVGGNRYRGTAGLSRLPVTRTRNGCAPAIAAPPAASSRRMLKEVVSGRRSHRACGTRAIVSRALPCSSIAKTVSVSRALVPGGVSSLMSTCGIPDCTPTHVPVCSRATAAACFPPRPVPRALKLRPKRPDLENTENWMRSRSYTSSESGPYGSIQSGRLNSPGPLPRLPMRSICPLPISYRMRSPSPPLARKTRFRPLSRFGGPPPPRARAAHTL